LEIPYRQRSTIQVRSLRRIKRMRRSVKGYTRALRRVQGAGLGLIFLLLLTGLARAQSFGGPVSPWYPDPCASGNLQVAAIAASEAGTTQIIALVATQSIYICGMSLNSVGGTSTIEYGTGSSCGTGTTTVTGAYAASSTVSIFPAHMTIIPIPKGNAVCLLAGMSTSNTAGFFTFVQQWFMRYLLALLSLLAWLTPAGAVCTQTGSASSTSTQVVPQGDISGGRHYFLIQNTGTTNAMNVAIGTNNNATSTDTYLAPGNSWVMTSQLVSGGTVLIPSGDVAVYSASGTHYEFCDW
jgi:hypothetical protein